MIIHKFKIQKEPKHITENFLKSINNIKRDAILKLNKNIKLNELELLLSKIEFYNFK